MIDTATSRLIGYYDRHGNIMDYWILRYTQQHHGELDIMIDTAHHELLDINIDTARSRCIGYYDRQRNIMDYWIL